MSDIAFVKGDKEKNYTVLDNTCIRDENLSWGAKGLHCYLEHLPGDWKIYKNYLISHFPDKRVALNNLINELVRAGYIVIEKKLRNPDGTFAPQRYIVFERPNNFQCRLSTADNATVDESAADNPSTDNQHLLNTKQLNTNIQKTELTNCKKEVSETVLVQVIQGLFGGEYPFDKNFEGNVLKCLSGADIDESNLEVYLQYVFERTRLANPIKSFEGLYRKLATADSILRDFKFTNHFTKVANEDDSNQHLDMIECPICHTVFNALEFYCPSCSLSVDAIKETDSQEIKIKTKIFQMSDVEREQYENAYLMLVKKKGKGYLSAEEKLQFYKNYGILD